MECLDQLCINTVRTLSIDAVQKADSGHPGLPLDAAPMAYVLWSRFLKHNPTHPEWYDRDRFVLSPGHGSMLLYSLLHLTGYPLSLDQIKRFRQEGSLTPGHPESELTPGVEVTTGPLGQGFGNGIGFAMAEAYLAAHYNRPGFNLIDHYTYGIVSDGDLMEGVAAESASLAGHLKLGKLIYLYDSNHITLSGSTQLTFNEEVGKRFEAYGWHLQTLEDGNDLTAIGTAIEAAQKETRRPSLIVIRTHIGYGSPHKQGTFEAHGSPLGVEEVKLTKQRLGWPPEKDFYIPKEAQEHFHKAIQKGKNLEDNWNELFSRYEKHFPDLAQELRLMIAQELPKGWDTLIPSFPADAKGISTRVAGGKVMEAIYPMLPGLIGGSADLNASTFTALINGGNFEPPDMAEGDRQGAVDGGWNYSGKNIFYGIREHAMGAISNGLAKVNGLIPFTATFLTFSDYMRPTIRLAALMQIRVVYVFTHDSLALGEDGPTHQPVEQLASLRAIPFLIVIRPSDANETAVAWQVAVETKDRPVALILTRQSVPTLDRHEYASAEGLRKGAYVLSEGAKGKPDLILIATGSEVGLIVEAQKELQAQKISVRLVSMPSWELFEAQTPAYRESVLPSSVSARLVVEAGVSQGWQKYFGDHGAMISVEKFGTSAPGPTVMKEYGFSVDNVCKEALSLIKRIKKR